MKYLEQIRAWWDDASSFARALFVLGVTALIGAGYYVAVREPPRDYAPLYTRLAPDDVTELSEELRQRNVPFKVEDNALFVPREQVRDLRLDLAAAGLPKGGGAGFELFDDNAVMMTNFTQRVNFVRALQGELGRTISQLPAVESARVHLAIPDKSIFTRGTGEPSASVYLRLYAGRSLTDRQVAGVAHLVSTAVDNLSVDRIAVIDGTGRMLSQPPATDEAGWSNRALSVAHDYERRLEKRIVELLEPVVGPGRVVARVNVAMDLSRKEETQEQYDPESATVRSERKLDENQTAQSQSPAGVAGTPGNIPQPAAPQPANNASSQSNSGRTSTHVDYAISKVVRHVQRPVGDLRRLSAAVLIDGASVGTTSDPGDTGEEQDAAEAAAEGEKPVPELQEAIPNPAALTELVKKAVGFSAARGDEIQLMFVPFAKPELEQVEAPPEDFLAGMLWFIIAGVGLLGGILALVAIVMVQKKRQAQQMEIHQQELEAVRKKYEEEAEAEEPEEEEELPPDIREIARELASQNPANTKNLIKGWLSSGTSST